MPEADLIFVGGRIFTLDPANPHPAAVSVTGGRISSVGDAGDVLAASGPRTTVVELARRTLVPGFYDAHQHQVYAGLARRQVDARVSSIAELDSRIVAAAG